MAANLNVAWLWADVRQETLVTIMNLENAVANHRGVAKKPFECDLLNSTWVADKFGSMSVTIASSHGTVLLNRRHAPKLFKV